MSGFAIIIATHGSWEWAKLARERAEPSAAGQGAAEIVVIHDDGGTVAATRNAAVRSLTKATWLCFLDADDELAPDYLEHISRAIGPHLLQGDALRGLYAPYVSLIRSANDLGSAPHIPNEGRWPRMNECVIGTVIHKSMFERVGGFREFSAYEDWDLFLRCHRHGAFIEHVPGAVYKVHQGANGRNVSGNLTEAYDKIWSDWEASA